jgi:hypothetical protein
MFSVVLVTCLLSAIAVCCATIALLGRPLLDLMKSRISASGAVLWSRTFKFATFVIGVSVGIRVWEIERFLQPDKEITVNVVVLEAYKTLLRTAQANLAMVLVIGLMIGVAMLIRPPTTPRDQEP